MTLQVEEDIKHTRFITSCWRDRGSWLLCPFLLLCPQPFSALMSLYICVLDLPHCIFLLNMGDPIGVLSALQLSLYHSQKVAALSGPYSPRIAQCGQPPAAGAFLHDLIVCSTFISNTYFATTKGTFWLTWIICIERKIRRKLKCF